MYIIGIFIEYATHAGFMNVHTYDDQFIGPFASEEEAEAVLEQAGFNTCLPSRSDFMTYETLEKNEKWIDQGLGGGGRAYMCSYVIKIIQLDEKVTPPWEYNGKWRIL